MSDGHRKPEEDQTSLLADKDIGAADERLGAECLHELFEAQARRTPEAVALVCGHERVSYRDLDRRSNGLAWRLRALGVGPEVPVGVCLERTSDLVVTLLAVLKAGGAYLPLDPGYPRERLYFMVEDSQVGLVIVSAGLEDRPPHRGELLVLETDDVSLARVGPRGGVGPGNLAYLLYTSGSTGRPRGVAVEHRSVTAFARWAQQTFSATELAGVLAATPIGFDLSVFELFVTLAWGGMVILAKSIFDLLKLPAAKEITLINTVPTIMAGLLDRSTLPASVRTVNLAGELPPRWLVQKVSAVTSVRRILNLYGPTETTIYCTSAEVESGEGDPPIGRPIKGAWVRLLDGHLNQVPHGEVGEIYVGGVGLARGYVGLPDLTAERFVPDPAADAVAGERVFRTGDLGRRGPEGELQYMGRRDHQVKLRGFRIELGEIEAALACHPGVSATVVVARVAPNKQGRLVAYVVAGGAAKAPDAAELREFLGRRLPAYMIPAAFVALRALPLTANGKLDRGALPEPVSEGPAGDLLQDEDETALARMFTELLGAPVGREDSPSMRGVDSLMAVELVARIREELGVELSLPSVLESATIAGLAVSIKQARLEGPSAEPPIRRVEREAGGLPLSFAQRRLWFLDALQPGSAAYNISIAYLLTGEIVAAALAGALSTVARRHEALRTIFQTKEGLPRQVIVAATDLRLPGIDLAGLPPSRREVEAKRLCSEDGGRPFNLATGPLLRTRLLRLESTQHWLLVSVHHIVADGWSLDILRRELATLYAGGRLRELRVQYADFAVWQDKLLAGERMKSEVEYWTRQLAGAPQGLNLPTDHLRPAIQVSRGAWRRRDLAPEATDRARILSRHQGVTLFMTLFGAFAAALERLTNQRDLLVGVPVANRSRRGLEDLIGLFVNTVVLRADLDGNPSFCDVLVRVRNTALGAYAHQDLPFERLVEELAPNRDLSRSPIFDVMFALENVVRSDVRVGPGLVLTERAIDNATAKFDLVMAVEESVEGLRLRLEYATDIFDGATAERWLSMIETMLAGAVADPYRRVFELPVVGEAERWQVIAEWNLTAEEGSPEPVHRLFEIWAEARPNAPAVTGEGNTLSYRELDRRATHLARRLRRLGVGAESVVALCLERSPELVTAMLAVLKAGGGFLPMEPSLPAERLTFIVEDAGAPVLLSRRDLLPGVGEGATRWAGAELVWLDAGLIETDGDVEPMPPMLGEQQLAYLIYTSGSSGPPKGVEVVHRGLSNLAGWHRRRYAVTPDDRATLMASPAFDAFVWEVWPYLTAGASLHVPPADVRTSPSDLLAWLARERITLCFLPTALAELVIAEPFPVDLALRTMLAGGESLRVRPRSKGQFRLVNHYGPTESSVVTTAGDVTCEGASLPTLGRPIANTRVYLVDRALQPVPVGVPGELCVSGRAVARGYRGRPDLTAERFVPDPFAADDPGERLYRTGDLARWSIHGEIEFLGRADRQIKIRGYRIEPGEIEVSLKRHPAVREAVVLVRGDRPEDKRLVAYLAVDELRHPQTAALRALLRASLPEYMVPAAFFFVPTLPRTAHGKVDRAALPQLEPPPSSWDYEAPRTATEEVVAQIWAEVLRVDRVGVSDDFFSLGGHSLLATRVASRVRSAFGVEIPLQCLFQAPTVESVATVVEDMIREQIEQASGGAVGSAALVQVAPSLNRAEAAAPQQEIEAPNDRHARRIEDKATEVAGSRHQLESSGRAAEVQASSAQERFWLLEELAEKDAPYNVPVALRLAKSLSISAVRAALREIVRRHEVLRATFALSGDVLVQRVLAQLSPAIPHVDLRSIERQGPAVFEREARRLEQEEAGRRFDLSRGPLIRGMLLQGEDEHKLLLTLHHIVCDARSIDILVDELEILYGAFAAGRPSPLPELPCQYADFTEWQRRELKEAALVRQLEYWRARLAGIPDMVSLPTDRRRPEDLGSRGDRITRALEPKSLDNLHALGRRAHATVFMVLLATLDVLLRRYTDQDDLVVGIPIAGRTWLKAEGLIGLFLNTVVVRSDLSGDPTFEALLAQVRDTAVAAYDNSDLPFAKLVEELRPERRLSQTPLFQILLAHHEMSTARSDGRSRLVQDVCWGSVGAKFDLTLSFLETENGALCEAEYNRHLFDGATIRRFLDHLWSLIENLLRQPSRSIRDLGPLSEAERRLLLVEWNDTEVAAPELPVHELFTLQAGRTPDAVAVTGEGEALTYGELEARASQLARLLAARGVGAETPVALLVERTPRLVVAILGILMAGGAYVPLDLECPAARLGEILDDLSGGAGRLFLVADAGLVGLLPEASRPPLDCQVLVDRLGTGQLQQGGIGVKSPAGLKNLMYIIYTSGSSGPPKGVAVEHFSVAVLVRWATAFYTARELSRILVSTRLIFDLSVFELFVPLATGGCAVIVRDVHALVDREAGAARGVTLINTVPSLLASLIENEGVKLPGPVCTVNLAGETLRNALVDRIDRPGIVGKVVNLYGPTEATVYATATTVVEGDTAEPTIGRPLDNVRVYILDDRLELQPVGVPGELFLGGVGLARGYWRRPDLTAAGFFPDPFAGADARMYRTGDRARRLPDGRIVFMGRLDRQLKVRGVRIEPQEIEEHLSRHPGVAQVAVTAADDAKGERHLVAYIVPRGERGTLDRAELRSFLARSLPFYLVPTVFVELSTMPLRPGGKVNMAALPFPDWTREVSSAAFVPPRPGVEQQLARIWAELLHVEQIGANDDFFDQGGQSMKAMLLKARIQDELGVELPLRRIFYHHQLSTLAEEIQQRATMPALPVGAEAWAPEDARESWSPEKASWSTDAPDDPATVDVLERLLWEKARAVGRRTTVDFPGLCHVDRAAALSFQVLVTPPIDPLLLDLLRLPFAASLGVQSLFVKVTAPAFRVAPERVTLRLPVDRDSEAVLFKLVPLEEGVHLVEIEVFAEAERVAYLTLESEAVADVN